MTFFHDPLQCFAAMGAPLISGTQRSWVVLYLFEVIHYGIKT